MIHLLMRFKEDTPVFTGMAFAKGSMASGVAEYKNREKKGFHYVGEFPVDSSEDYDGSDEVAETVAEVSIVMADDGKEELVYSVHTDAAAADMMVEAKSALNPTVTYRIVTTRVNHAYPPDMGDAGTLAVL